ncbi:MAG: hypothetical protein LQ342_004639 [Letrouitia transgressa]|nr:MAG: hypothetical protein LQ342_004639 [Letrouitia transgressa]
MRGWIAPPINAETEANGIGVSHFFAVGIIDSSASLSANLAKRMSNLLKDVV